MKFRDDMDHALVFLALLITLIAYVQEKRGWCVTSPRGDPLSGPYQDHADADRPGFL